MKKIIIENEQLESIILDESSITSIEWINEGVDIRMKIYWCGQESYFDKIDMLNIFTNLFFRGVNNVEINFAYTNDFSIGNIEITKFSFKRVDSRYFVDFTFDFQPQGYIKFQCDDIIFSIVESLQ